MKLLASLALLLSAALASSTARAQVPYVTYYQPAASYYPAPVGAYTAHAPVVVSRPAATVTYYRAPAAYYGTTTTYYSPRYVAPVVTRYRPLLGGTVARYPYRAPVVYYGW